MGDGPRFALCNLQSDFGDQVFNRQFRIRHRFFVCFSGKNPPLCLCGFSSIFTSTNLLDCAGELDI